MKIKAEDLKAGQVIKHQGEELNIGSAVKRFYKNGRAKIEVGAWLPGLEARRRLVFKADTKLEINGEF